MYGGPRGPKRPVENVQPAQPALPPLLSAEDAISLLNKNKGYVLSSETAERLISFLKGAQTPSLTGFVARRTSDGTIVRDFALPGEQHPIDSGFEWLPVYQNCSRSLLSPERAFELGWCTAANWANRDDLVSDIGSPAYMKDMQETLSKENL